VALGRPALANKRGYHSSSSITRRLRGSTT
jgi:hypothetical protein